MNDWNLPLYVLGTAVMLLSLFYGLIERYKTRRTLKRLNRMLDLAIDGNFSENVFDESLLSSVEGRFHRYLTASAISARNLNEEKEMIKELLSDLSHQTKTPISNILLYAQLLEEQELPAAGVACVIPLRGQAEKLSALIDSLIKLSRLETGVFTLHPALTAVFPMLEAAMLQFVPKAAEKRISLTAEPTDASAVFDSKWTTEALCNLVDNAIKYTPDGGMVQISVREYEQFCRIDITDSGMGISEAERSKVFSRFYRSPSVGEQDGAGIGLYLARQILIGQGGYIKVSQAPGGGSIFSMFLSRED